MKKGLLGLAVGAAAAFGGTLAAKKFFGSGNDDSFGGASTTDFGATGSAGTATQTPRREGLDPTLLEILACPDDKQPVIYQREGDAERLTCTKCGKRYPVRDGIPVMLIDEATTGPVPTEEEIAAAKKTAPEGKPAIVGATSTASAPAPSTGAASSSTSAGASAPGTASATGPTASASSPTTTAEGSPSASSSTQRISGGGSLDTGSGVG